LAYSEDGQVKSTV